MKELTFQTACLLIRGMLKCCRDLFAEGISYDILVSNFVLVEGYEWVLGNSVFFSVIVPMSFHFTGALTSVTGLQ